MNDRKIVTVRNPSNFQKLSPFSDTIQWFHYEKCTLAELYPAFSIASLMQMLKDDALSHLHRDITQALLTIFGSLGPSCTLYVSKVKLMYCFF